MLITTEMLMDTNVKKLIRKIESENREQIQKDFDYQPLVFPDLLTWLELHPEIVGRYFMQMIIDYGYTNEDIN